MTRPNAASWWRYQNFHMYEMHLRAENFDEKRARELGWPKMTTCWAKY